MYYFLCIFTSCAVFGKPVGQIKLKYKQRVYKPLIIQLLFFSAKCFGSFRGTLVAYHGNNLAAFLFHCMEKLQSQLIEMRKVSIDFYLV